MHPLDLIRDHRTKKISAEKLWYNVKSGMSVFCLWYYITHPTPDGFQAVSPLIIVIFLFLNEASAIYFIKIAAKKYGIDLNSGNGSGQGSDAGDQLDTDDQAGGDSGSNVSVCSTVVASVQPEKRSRKGGRDAAKDSAAAKGEGCSCGGSGSGEPSGS